jgi:hypothetical protein
MESKIERQQREEIERSPKRMESKIERQQREEIERSPKRMESKMDIKPTEFVEPITKKEKSITQKAIEEIPIISISESRPFDDQSDSSPSDPQPPSHPEMEIMAAHEKRTAPSKRRDYAPERWELDTFDELKSFGSAIRQKLSEKHMMLNHVIEDTVASSLKEVTDFMSKCDSELGQLRTDFIMSSAQISKDIAQKQKMVEELGTQQSEHIQQMMKDCDVIQRRVEDLLRRFSQQKKTLLANQEKHIALFRDDMLSEVKAAVTKGKRESSKQMVQKLVNLLDEL